MPAKKKMSTKKKVEIGAGALAVAAAVGAAGYYFYGDKNAKKHRQAASTWAKGMKREVVKEAKKLKKLDQKAMAKVVDKASAMYEGVRSVDRKDLQAAAAELKKNWSLVKGEVAGGVSKARKAVKKAVKKTAKKAPKKAVKKVAKKSVKKAAKRSR